MKNPRWTVLGAERNPENSGLLLLTTNGGLLLLNTNTLLVFPQAPLLWNIELMLTTSNTTSITHLSLECPFG